MKTQLEVGDRICHMWRGAVHDVFTIERVTKTMAITEQGFRYRRKIGPLGIQLVVRDPWARSNYQLETPELQALLRLQIKRKEVELSLCKLTKKSTKLNIDQLRVLDNRLTNINSKIGD